MRASAVAGIILANSNDHLLNKLTGIRSMASVPFGGRYRLIDFALSNLVNAGVNNVGIITRANYRSLMDHISSGAAWDLDRKSGGIHMLPPYNVSGARRYHGDVEALYGAKDFMNRSHADYIVICESDTVANIDLSEALDSHVKNEADVTVVYTNGLCPQNHPNTMILNLDDDGRVSGMEFAENRADEVDYAIGTVIITRKLLVDLVEEAYESGATRVGRDVFAPEVSKLKVFGFKHEGFTAIMDSENTYFESNMRLLEKSSREQLFGTRPVYTKTRDDMPTRYGTKADVHNSFIADGCVIDGTVKNSVLFRGVTVEKGAVVENCILMQGVKVGADTRLDYIISDKNSAVGRNMVLKGNAERPFIISKNKSL